MAFFSLHQEDGPVLLETRPDVRPRRRRAPAVLRLVSSASPLVLLQFSCAVDGYPDFRPCPKGYAKSSPSSPKCYDGTAKCDGGNCCDVLHGGYETCPVGKPNLCAVGAVTTDTTAPLATSASAVRANLAGMAEVCQPDGACSASWDSRETTCKTGCTVVNLKPVTLTGSSGTSAAAATDNSQNFDPAKDRFVFRSAEAAYSLVPSRCFADASSGCGLRVCDAPFLEVLPLEASQEHLVPPKTRVTNLTGSVMFEGSVVQKQISFTGRDVWTDAGPGCCQDPLVAHSFAGQRGLTLAQCQDLCRLRSCDFIEFSATATGPPSVSGAGTTSSASTSTGTTPAGVCRAFRGACRNPQLGACAEDGVHAALTSSSFRTYTFVPAVREVHIGTTCDAGEPPPQLVDANAEPPTWAATLLSAPTCGDTEVCRDGRCHRTCVSSVECAAYPYRVCDFWDETKTCSHKDLFASPIDMDLLGTFLFFVFSGLALSAGVGGGGIYVPLLILLLRFRPHKATAVSQSMLAGGALSVLAYNIRQRHPTDRTKSMVDFDLTVILGFPLMAGVQMGAVIHKISPDWLILFLLIAVLTDSGRRTLRKGLSLWRDENKKRAAGGDPGASGNVLLGKAMGAAAGATKTAATQLKRTLSGVGSPPTSYREFEDEDLPEVIGMPSDRHVNSSDKDVGPLKQLTRKNSPGEETRLTTLSPRSLEGTTSLATSVETAPSLASQAIQMVVPFPPGEVVGGDSNTARDLRIDAPPDSRSLNRTSGSSQDGDDVADGSLQRSPGNALSSPGEENPGSTFYPGEKPEMISVGRVKSMLVGIWLVMLMVSGVKTNMGYCTLMFWVTLLAASGGLLSLAYTHAQRLVHQFHAQMARKPATPSPTSEKTMAKSHKETWEFFDSRGSAIRLIGYAYGAGGVAAMCGIGGGMLLGPIMMEMGLRPQVTTATTATTLFMLSTTASTIFIVSGQAPLVYSLFFAVVCCCGAILGKSVINHYVKKYDRSSMIALILAGVIIVSTIMLLLIGLLDLFSDVSAASRGSNAAKRDLWFKGLCATVEE